MTDDESHRGDYPRRIRVGTVTYRASDTPEDWVDADHNRVGETDHTLAVIRIKPGMAPDVVRVTLWHEVLHAVMWSMLGGPQWNDLGADQDAREEFIVARLEHPTLAVLRDNPGLVRYLTAE